MIGSVRFVGERVGRGERKVIPLSLGRRKEAYSVPLHVVNGRESGPVLFVMAGLHGDEINGVAIIRSLLGSPLLQRLRGTLLAVPIANLPGVLGRSRYLAEREDLNRAFTGNAHGSHAEQIAHELMERVVSVSDVGIDLHTGRRHHDNYPHLRVEFSHPRALALARAFGTRVILDAPVPGHSLRQAARERGVPVLVYEGGEALRWSRLAIEVGVEGVIKVMGAMGMVPADDGRGSTGGALLAREGEWMRAPFNAFFYPEVEPGERLEEGRVVGRIVALGEGEERAIRAPHAGMLLTLNRLPVVRAGEAICYAVHG